VGGVASRRPVASGDVVARSLDVTFRTTDRSAAL
jgi:hypothetical protein